ncbi:MULTISPECIES: hypothetical protein [Desulfosediminicola]|uniref:hypothetical protein n=1 Tax=Desulfosediminicola TaxID=2886823 RepID=UPI0010AB88ED|nr:hypothetical protein [Desulfosediminicola ganghwensis]
MITTYPFYFQYQVRPTGENDGYSDLSGAIATVMVFAEDIELAKARAGRHVARNHWEIIEVKRTMMVRRHHVENMEGMLKSVYKKAEQAGVAAVFDGWYSSGTRVQA